MLQESAAFPELAANFYRNGISRTVELPSFRDAVDAIVRIADVAEEMDHHPDVDLRWRTLHLALVSHSEGGVTTLDLQLAQGTGFGVIRRLRAATGSNPACIVVLTNHAVPALKVAAFEAGADYFLDKSKDFATIPRLIGELLSSRQN